MSLEFAKRKVFEYKLCLTAISMCVTIVFYTMNIIVKAYRDSGVQKPTCFESLLYKFFNEC